MKPFIGRGDNGFTDTLGKKNISKGDLLIEVIGDIDEAIAFLSWSTCQITHPDVKSTLSHIILDLSNLMAVLAGENSISFESDRILWLEETIKKYGSSVIEPKGFKFDWKNLGSNALNITRTVIRRLERRFVQFIDQPQMPNQKLIYVNRLSSLIYVLQNFLEQYNE